MRRRSLLAIGAVLTTTLLVVVAWVQLPRTVTESSEFTLSSEQSPSWLETYCVPDGTPVAFSWHTSDGSSTTVQAWNPSLLSEYQYRQAGSVGSGSFHFTDPEEFAAVPQPPSGVQIEVDLTFTVTGSYLSGPPSFGPC